MTLIETLGLPGTLAAALGLGAALGALYFGLLARAVRLQTSGAGALQVGALHLLRLAAALAVFWALAQQGALPLLAALLGFLVARVVVQRRVLEA